MHQKLTVWYNTKCPVCDAGIEWQGNRLIQAVRAGTIEFRDINLEPKAVPALDADLEAVRRRLHGMNADGQVFKGVDCVIEIWLRTPGDAWLGKLLALPILRQLTRFGYNRFADALYIWNRRRGHWRAGVA